MYALAEKLPWVYLRWPESYTGGTYFVVKLGNVSGHLSAPARGVLGSSPEKTPSRLL